MFGARERDVNTDFFGSYQALRFVYANFFGSQNFSIFCFYVTLHCLSSLYFAQASPQICVKKKNTRREIQQSPQSFNLTVAAVSAALPISHPNATRLDEKLNSTSRQLFVAESVPAGLAASWIFFFSFHFSSFFD